MKHNIIIIKKSIPSVMNELSLRLHTNKVQLKKPEFWLDHI